MFFGDDLLRASVEEVTAIYPAGIGVKVFYHPDRPNLSVLEPGWHRELLFYVVVGVVLVLVGIVLAGRLAA